MASPNGHARRKEWYCWCVEPAGDTSQAKNFLTQSCDILILWSFANPATSHDTAQYKRKGTLLGFSIVRLDFQDLSNWRISSLRHHCLTGYLCEPWDIELMKILTSLVSKSMLPWVVFFYLCVALSVGIAQGVLEACKRWLSSPKVTVKHKVSVPKSFSRSEKGSHAKHHGVHRKRVFINSIRAIAIPHRSRFSHSSTPRPWQTAFVTKSSKWETASKDVKKFGHLESFKFQWST